MYSFIYFDKPYADLIPVLSFVAVSATFNSSFQLVSTSLNVLNNSKVAFEAVVEELKKKRGFY